VASSFPQTAEDIENYKKTMIARYEAELLENAARLNIRPRVMSTKVPPHPYHWQSEN
jgi:hypothetical protein